MRFKGLAIAAIGLVGALLPMTAGQALQWVLVAEADDGSGDRLYVDADSVKRRGNMVQYWSYYVSRQPDEDGVSSTKMFRELNCATGSFQLLRITHYNGGQVLSNRQVRQPGTIVPGTMSEGGFNWACK